MAARRWAVVGRLVAVRSIHHPRYEFRLGSQADPQVHSDCFGILGLAVPPDCQLAARSSADSLEEVRIEKVGCKTYFGQIFLKEKVL